MYVPAVHRFEDPDALRAFMRHHPFALLTSQVDGEPFATQLPVTLAQDGARLLIRGHMARLNPHAAALDGATALVVFGGPHAYVSPRHYDEGASVPTWNYVAVHASGPVRTLDAGDVPAHEALLADLIAEHEPAYQARWDALPGRYRLAMIRGIVGFELEVVRLQGKAKLSQNKSVEERRRIAEALAGSGSAEARSTARVMEALARGEPPAAENVPETVTETVPARAHTSEDGDAPSFAEGVECPVPHE